MIQIGTHRLANPVALAPMAGVTDLPFRQLCKRLGAGLVVSEMVTSDQRLRGSRKTRLRLHHSPECEPRSIQIAGGDPAMLAEAARVNEAEGADIIDINMGCPAKKVCRKAAGSALLRDEGLVAEILRAVVAAVSVPVTLKIRTGWSPEQRNGVSVARLAEDAGVQALAVHGRTRSCRFEGSAEYETIAAIVDAVSIPVFANGDIDTPLKASQVLERTGAAGVMIGRAAQGKPWLCGQVAHFLATGELQGEPTAAVQQQLLLGHLDALHHFYGEYTGVRVARKHVSWYLQGRPHSAPLRRAFNRLESPHEQTQFITRFFQADGESAAALEELAA